jgi:hypothetical protein
MARQTTGASRARARSVPIESPGFPVCRQSVSLMALTRFWEAARWPRPIRQICAGILMNFNCLLNDARRWCHSPIPWGATCG